jgi:hypothetical protein
MTMHLGGTYEEANNGFINDLALTLKAPSYFLLSASKLEFGADIFCHVRK